MACLTSHCAVYLLGLTISLSLLTGALAQQNFSVSPTKSPTKSPTLSCAQFCPTLTTATTCNAETHCGHCVWSRSKCHVETRWLGYTEIGQTHVIRAMGETRHAPLTVADREAELLFFPTLEAQATLSPSMAPSETVLHEFGLELIGNLTVDLARANDTWPAGYPKDKAILLVPGTEYYIPGSINDIDINFDLLAQRAVQGVAVQIWYYSQIQSIDIGVRSEDSALWKWYKGGSATSGNQRVLVTIPKTAARYVRISIRGGTFGGVVNTQTWGLRHIQISGSLDGQFVDPLQTNNENSAGIGFIPSQQATVLLEIFNKTGAQLGSMTVRNTTLQRPLLEQALVTSTLNPYASIDMWSVTVPWRWMKEGNQLRFSVLDSSRKVLTHTLTLHGLAQWSEHTLIRNKVAIFGNATDLLRLDSFTLPSSKLATGMFAAMPVASLNWVDPELWHLPYIVVATNAGPRLVRSEMERRQAYIDAGQTDYGTEPEWAVLKNQLAYRHAMANTGRGFSVTILDAPQSPYASETSIFMGWSLTDSSAPGGANWDKLGYWNGWSAAAWRGWCAMAPGDECGNTLIHELGHSQTMYHFTTGTAASWGIANEYPQDGTNTMYHPWGYDTVTRRFRTWYNHLTGNGKRDPMNGGESPNSETCFPQYTGYHAKKAQNWAKSIPVLLSSKTSGIARDGAYQFNEVTRQYDKIADAAVVDEVEEFAMPPVKVGVPVITIIGTLGNLIQTCQTYPPMRASAGNTFRFPNPLDPTLSSTIYNGASYFVQVTFSNGTKTNGLVAVPNLSASTELRYFSFNIAMTDRPTKVEVFRYNTVSYPNIVAGSNATRIHTRAINLATSSLAGIPSTVKVGRGWLGESGDIEISKMCVSDADCEEKSTVLKWRGTDIASYKSVGLTTFPQGNRTAFNITVSRLEDKRTFVVTLLATRFINDKSAALLGPIAGGAGADATQGVKFWLPYDLNSHLSFGTYKALVPGIQANMQSGSRFADLRFNVNIGLPVTTATANLTSGYTSPGFAANASSVYFLMTDPLVGPTVEIWWGTSTPNNLTVPLVSFNCNKTVVKASVLGSQKSCNYNSPWEMNAGKSADSCNHYLLLNLASPTVNTWRSDVALQGCKFETHPTNPIQINVHRWHNPSGGAVIGRMTLKMEVQL